MLAVATMSLARAAPLRAQAHPRPTVPVPPLVALAISDLTFGTVLPGIPSSVSVGDPHHAGLFEINGPAGTSVRVEFALPMALAGDGGALLAISFGPGDGFADFDCGPGLVFNPHAPVIGALGPTRRLHVRMGGTVLPGRPQAGGAYHATISLTVYNLGS